jgi:hypothetical protein
MTSLRELQTRMLEALLNGPSGDAAELIDAAAPIALSRLQVYRNNVLANFADALRLTYPAIWRLVGEDYFRQTARNFQRRQPSQSGDLVHAGRCFADHLDELHAESKYRYFADVARLEWLIQDALLAAEHAPLDLEKMAGVAASAYDTLRFELHPSLRLFESRYPALRIWEVNVGSDEEPESVNLDAGGERLAIMRHRLQLRFHRLSAGEHRLLDEIRRGATFMEAVDAAARSDAEFDAAAALQRFVSIEAIVDCR